MGFSPETSVVVEDSLFGVQAARAAGMRVLGFARDVEPTVLLDAGAQVFHKMEELPELIAAMYGKGASGRVGLG
jgi:beta-phosphoglucomutase-like phosphatase (HAD superfamily)